MLANPISEEWPFDDVIIAQVKKMFRRMFDQSLSKSKALGDMLRLLPGVAVQRHMSMQGMAVLYRIKPELLERLIKSFIKPLRHVSPLEPLIRVLPFYRIGFLDSYLSGFLQNQERSQGYYCDPKLQHISICRHFLFLLDRSNAFDLQ